jgi:hypothetical protein
MPSTGLTLGGLDRQGWQQPRPADEDLLAQVSDVENGHGVALLAVMH